MNTLLYISYGLGPHVQEVIFSILSAARHGRSAPSFRVVVYTDTPNLFQGLDATIEGITPQELIEWAGPGDFPLRRKIVALQRAMRQGGSSTALMDGDTYFLRTPERLFSRLAAGTSLMHVQEGNIGNLIALGPLRTKLPGLSLTLSRAASYELTVNTPMWNSGVVGIDPADAGLLDEVLELCDAIYAAHPNRMSEQIAFTSVLNRHTIVKPSRDIVFHYHQDFLRDPFRQRLPILVEQWEGLSIAERANRAYAYRPVPTSSKTVKAAMKRALKPLGLFRHDLETSV